MGGEFIFFVPGMPENPWDLLRAIEKMQINAGFIELSGPKPVPADFALVGIGRVRAWQAARIGWGQNERHIQDIGEPPGKVLNDAEFRD